MRSTTLFLAFGFALAATTSAAPLSQLTPSMRPSFTVVSRVDASTATGVANVTAGESPKHEHTPECEHNYNGKHNVTSHYTHNLDSEGKGNATEAEDHATKAMGNPLPYPGINASAYAHPHTVQAHKHTGDYCNQPFHNSTTTTGASYDKIIHPRMPNAEMPRAHNHTGYYCTHPSHHNGTSAPHGYKYHDKKLMGPNSDETHNHTGYSCTHPLHHNGTTTTIGHSYEKKSAIPSVDVTVCLGADCKESKVVTANVDSAGELTGIDAKDSKRQVKRQVSEMSYEDVARQMSGARIAGGI
ncbi:MAG: hypothetical protein ALECFALPRED_007257 [Alectoria fallacina]|uniref:Uncharacterized protein n=1 Tax=Alectoria fallacina TaxID=1903189 RepID=A0A8H3J087_9LECA|nr:MAG: hypothetical protein ALECFALPRED_007257 [Alectoria fallacina]